MKQILLIFFILFFAAPTRIQRKIIHDTNFNYEFFVLLDDERNVDKEKWYYWFKGGEIQSTFGGIGGEPLHGNFIKYYKTSQLAEKGNFKAGLKVGDWKKWFETGEVKEVVSYSNGVPHGPYLYYDNTGKLIEHGRYRSGKKVGRWIENKTDTLLYRSGKLKIKKDPALKENLFKRLFSKDTIKEKDLSKKKYFFKKLFPKKNKKDNSTVQKDSVSNPFFKRVFGIFKRQKTESEEVKQDVKKRKSNEKIKPQVKS